MKNILTIAGLVLSTSLFAAGPVENPSLKSEMAIIRKDDNTIKLFYKSSVFTNVKISIRNEANKVVFEETLRNTEGFVRPYNLEKLTQGQYTLEIVDGSGKQSQLISIGEVQESKMIHVIKLKAEGKFLLTASGMGKEEITVNIYNDAHVLVHNQVNAISGNHAELFNLSKIKGGATFEIVHADGKIQTQTF